MKKRLLKTAIATALTVAFAVPAFANPFSDVPSNHWAYDAVNKLAQAGIVDGYGDGTYKGDKTMTRYEMAQIVAKAMNKDLNPDQKATVDQLSKEFATELNTLGVKVDGLQNQVDNMVKVSGDARVRYFNTEDKKDVTDYRARISFDGKINDDMHFNARLSSGNALSDGKANGVALDTANVSFNALGLTNTVGRQDLKIGSGFLIDDQMTGIATKAGGFKLFAGNASTNAKVDPNSAYDNVGLTAADTVWNRVYGAEYNTNILGADLNLAYLKNNSSEDEFYGANTSFKIAKGVSANAEYFKNNGDNKNDAAAKAYGLKLDKIGLSATYRDVDANGITPFSTLVTNTTDQYADLAGGFKGMEYQYDTAFNKNATFTVKYQDFEKQDGSKLDGRTSAAVNVKF